MSSGGNLSTVSVADTSSSEEFLTPTIRPMLNSGEMRANEIFKDLKIHIAANPYIQQERKKLQTTKTSTMAHSPSSSSSSLSLSAPSTPTKENEKEELRKMRKERKGKDKIMHDDSEPIFRSIYQGESPLNIFGQVSNFWYSFSFVVFVYLLLCCFKCLLFCYVVFCLFCLFCFFCLFCCVVFVCFICLLFCFVGFFLLLIDFLIVVNPALCTMEDKKRYRNFQLP